MRFTTCSSGATLRHRRSTRVTPQPLSATTTRSASPTWMSDEETGASCAAPAAAAAVVAAVLVLVGQVTEAGHVWTCGCCVQFAPACGVGGAGRGGGVRCLVTGPDV